MGDLNPEQGVNWSKVSEGELVIELGLVHGNESARVSSHRAVIYMRRDDEDVALDPSIKHSRIGGTGVETEVSQLVLEGIIPSAPHLLKPIQGLPQPVDKVLSSLLIAQRLLHVDLLRVLQLSVEVCRVEVEAFNLPVKARGKCEDGLEACKLGYRGISVKVIDTIYLAEPPGDQACLVLVNASIRFVLQSVDPLAADDILVRRAQHCLPCAGLLQQLNLAVHHLLPAMPVGARLCLA